MTTKKANITLLFDGDILVGFVTFDEKARVPVFYTASQASMSEIEGLLDQSLSNKKV